MVSQVKIFLVDDDPFSLNSYKEQLVNYGFVNVSIMSSGEECLRRMNEKPEVIFIDHHMDEMNGLELLQKIKRYYPGVRLVIVSGRQCVRTAVNALKLGANDYILKGDEEVKRMRHIIKQTYVDKRSPEKRGSFSDPYKKVSSMLVVIVILFVLQTSVLIYYFYDSIYYAFLSMIVLMILCGTGLFINERRKCLELI